MAESETIVVDIDIEDCDESIPSAAGTDCSLSLEVFGEDGDPIEVVAETEL